MASVDQVQRTFGATPSDSLDSEIEGDMPMTSYKRRLVSRTGGLLEISAVATDTLPSETGRPDSVVQFIHQTVKEYVQLSQHELGPPFVSADILYEDGNMFLLRSFTAQERWVPRLKKNVFGYAKKALEARQGKEGYGSSAMEESEIAILVSKALPLTGPFNLDWFLSEHLGSFCDALRKSVKDNEYGVVMAKLADAMGFPEYVHDTQASRYPGLLQVAACGGLFGEDASNVDEGRSIRYLLTQGCPVDAVDDWIEPCFTTIFPLLLPALRATALAVALLARNVTEEPRLRIVEELLKSGANPNIPSYTIYMGGPILKDPYSALQISVCYHSAGIVRLLLNYRADTGTKFGLNVYTLAILRGDRTIIEALLDHGISGISVGEDPTDDFTRSGLMSSLALAASIPLCMSRVE